MKEHHPLNIQSLVFLTCKQADSVGKVCGTPFVLVIHLQDMNKKYKEGTMCNLRLYIGERLQDELSENADNSLPKCQQREFHD